MTERKVHIESISDVVDLATSIRHMGSSYDRLQVDIDDFIENKTNELNDKIDELQRIYEEARQNAADYYDASLVEERDKAYWNLQNAKRYVKNCTDLLDNFNANGDAVNILRKISDDKVGKACDKLDEVTAKVEDCIKPIAISRGKAIRSTTIVEKMASSSIQKHKELSPGHSHDKEFKDASQKIAPTRRDNSQKRIGVVCPKCHRPYAICRCEAICPNCKQPYGQCKCK